MDDPSQNLQDQINEAVKKTEDASTPPNSEAPQDVSQAEPNQDDEKLTDTPYGQEKNPETNKNQDDSKPEQTDAAAITQDILNRVQNANQAGAEADKADSPDSPDSDSAVPDNPGLVDQLIKSDTASDPSGEIVADPVPEKDVISVDSGKPSRKNPRKKGVVIAMGVVLILLILLPVAVFYISNKNISLGDIRNLAVVPTDEPGPYPSDEPDDLPTCADRPGTFVCRWENPDYFSQYNNPAINIYTCKSDGTIASVSGYDVCGTPYDPRYDNCDGAIKTSSAYHPDFGSFVGCYGDSYNCYCGGPGDYNTPIGHVYGPGQMVCRFDDNCDSCARDNQYLCNSDTTPTPGGGGGPTGTPPPTVPQCNDICTSDSNCPSGMTCTEEGYCRNPSCEDQPSCICPSPTPSPSPTPTPIIECNDTCSGAGQCPDELVCSNGKCRNPDCTYRSDCTCPAPSDTPTPSPTPVVFQCEDIRIYKDGVPVDNLSALVPGDVVEVGVAGVNATKARVRINGSAWTESNSTNANGEYVVTFTLQAGVSDYTIEAEVYRNNQWQ